MLTLLAALAVQQSAAPHQPDRSGEATLKKVFANMGQLHSLEAYITRTTRRDANGVFMPAATLTFLFQRPGRFRVFSTDSMEGGELFVSDGTTLLTSPIDDEEPAVLTNAKPAIYSQGASLGSKGTAFSALYYLLDGDAGYKAIVSSKGDIKPVADGASEEISFNSDVLGEVALWYRKGDPKMLVTRIEYDNPAMWEDVRKTRPWRAPESPMQREEIEYVQIDKAMPGRLFQPTPFKGKAVQDKRKKG
jgi:hypothetical protein